jgi:hypothetical protein
MSKPEQRVVTYQGTCPECGRPLRFQLPATSSTLDSEGGKWYRGACCGQITYCEDAKEPCLFLEYPVFDE